MINCVLLIISALIIHSSLVAGEIVSSDLDPTEDIIIYYGLNDSHSRSWVQEDENGIVGITYFQRFEGNYTEGTLIYRTVHPNGSEIFDSVTTGTRLEKSVLLYDSLSSPHIFVARSDNSNQAIDHYYQNTTDQWESETIVNFYNEGGRFIYELSAARGPDYAFHLLILKTRSDIDSDDFMDAWINSYLYHMTSETGVWERDLVQNYDMAFTYDMYIKSSSRQDIKVDDDGYVHVTFSEQINAVNDPSRLLYATNKTGAWVVETALSWDYGVRDDAGWFPSLCLDNNGIPYVSCMYVNRVMTYSAVYSKLLLLKRLGFNNWQSEIVAEQDDGYYGGDGRNYTGGLTHLVFDKANTPHIIFSDIASTHWPGSQRLCVGNIRYAVFEDDVWNITKIYDQPRPSAFLNATEMYGMCLVLSDETNVARVIGQELQITGEYQYTCRLLDFEWPYGPEICCGEFTGGFTGNADCSEDGARTLSDVTRLVDFLYISRQPLCCPASGNTNGDVGAVITLSDITRLIDHIYISKQETEVCTAGGSLLDTRCR